MKYVRIKQKTSQGYTPYDVVNNANNVDYYYGNQTLEHYLQSVANAIISPGGVYWEDKQTLSGANFNTYKICNDGKFYVIVYSTKGSTSRNSLSMRVSHDGGYTWRQYTYRVDSEDVSNYLRVFDAKIALTSVGYKLVVLAGRENSLENPPSYYVGTVESYAFYFAYNESTNANYVPYNMFSFKYNNTFESSGGRLPSIVKLPQGFLAMAWNQEIDNGVLLANFDSYLYNRNFSKWGTINGLNYMQTPSWDKLPWGNSDYSTIPVGGSIDTGFAYIGYDSYLDTVITHNANGIYALSPYNNMSSIGAIVSAHGGLPLKDFAIAFGGVVSLENMSIDCIRFITGTNSGEYYFYELPELTEGDEWAHLVGNNYRLYIISKQGEVAYINGVIITHENNSSNVIVNDLIMVNQSEDAVVDTTFNTLKSYAPLTNAEFVCDTENCDIVGVVYDNDSDDGTYKIIHTHTGVLG